MKYLQVNSKNHKQRIFINGSAYEDKILLTHAILSKLINKLSVSFFNIKQSISR